MKGLIYLMLGLSVLMWSQPSRACRGVFSHRYILLEKPPARLPPTAVLLEVLTPDFQNSDLGPDGFSVSGQIKSAKNKRLIGRTIKIQQRGYSSCDRWASSINANYVVGFLTKKHGELTILPVAYRSSEYRTEAEDQSERIERLKETAAK